MQYIDKQYNKTPIFLSHLARRIKVYQNWIMYVYIKVSGIFHLSKATISENNLKVIYQNKSIDICMSFLTYLYRQIIRYSLMKIIIQYILDRTWIILIISF